MNGWKLDVAVICFIIVAVVLVGQIPPPWDWMAIIFGMLVSAQVILFRTWWMEYDPKVYDNGGVDWFVAKDDGDSLRKEIIDYYGVTEAYIYDEANWVEVPAENKMKITFDADTKKLPRFCKKVKTESGIYGNFPHIEIEMTARRWAKWCKNGFLASTEF